MRERIGMSKRLELRDQPTHAAWRASRVGLFLCIAAALAIEGCLVTHANGQGASSAPRPFAPGVVTTIPPDFNPAETVLTHDLVEIRANPDAPWQPELLTNSRTLYGISENVKFRRDVWCLEFSFKPLRMIYVDVPQPNGKMERKLIWYLVYAVRNTGGTLTPTEAADGTFSALPGQGGPLRFIPSLVLEAQDRDASGGRLYKAYLDRVIPAAYAAIRDREARNRTLLNSAQMAEEIIAVSAGSADGRLWGVATWEDVDPRIDFFSVYVGGLTNAYRWIDPPGEYQPGDPPGTGRRFVRKMLQLNFWRPGDEHYQDESEVRYGVPLGKSELYDVAPGVAYRWVYR
jgi:hypothetical protein